jgi:hypothetical protein
MDEQFNLEMVKTAQTGAKTEVKVLYRMGECLQSMLGFLVLVPSNPEAQSYFQIIDGILNFLKKEQWGTSEASFAIQVRVLDGCVRYLCSQAQETLPYHLEGVESNDRVFTGHQAFHDECEQMIDYCFSQMTEIIQRMDEVKDQYYSVLFESCLDAANLIVSTCDPAKPTNSCVNKMFKLSDGYLLAYNAKVP